MKRHDDWPTRLAGVIEAARAAPVGYGVGEMHCCRLAGDAVLAMTGVDPMAWFRGRYRTERRAYAVLKRFAGGGLEEAMARVSAECGMERVAAAFACRGDVVMHDTPEGPGLGICLGAVFVSVYAAGGVAFRPLSEATAAWRV